MLPTLFAVSITQINLLIDTLIASFLQTGSISWLYYSDRMVELPLGVFGVALATVILPNLSTEHARGNNATFSGIVSWALGLVFMIAIPAAAGLALLSVPILTTLFQYAEFTTHDVIMSSKSLMAYAIGLPGFILIKVFSSAFFSRQDTSTPVKIAAIAMVANIVLNLLLVGYFQHAGLALASSLSAYLNSGLLYMKLRQSGIFVSLKPEIKMLRIAFIAVILMSVFLLVLTPEQDIWFQWDVYQRVMQLVLWIVAGIVTYTAGIFIQGVRLRDLTSPK